MQIPKNMQDDQRSLLGKDKEKAFKEEDEKVKARFYVLFAVLIFFILFIVGILLIAFSKMNEKNENDIAGIVLAVVGGLGLILLILYAWVYSENL